MKVLLAPLARSDGGREMKNQIKCLLQNILIENQVSLNSDTDTSILWPSKRITCIWAFFDQLFVLRLNLQFILLLCTL